MNILLASPIDDGAVQTLREKHDVVQGSGNDPQKLKEMIRDREALIFRSGVDISAELMACAPELKLLMRAGSGLDNIDLDYMRSRHLALVRIPEPGARAVAELAFGMMLMFSRQILSADRMLRIGQWAKHQLTGHLLVNKQLGIVGLGSIGTLRFAHARNNYGKVPKRSDYQKNIERYYASGRGLVLGGLVDGKLAGYMTSYAIGTTAYVDELFLDSRYLCTNISLGLFFDWMQICRRTESIREVVHGLHAREATGLCRYKEELGLSVVHIPARIWFAPFADKLVKKLRPHVYYRLTGHD